MPEYERITCDEVEVGDWVARTRTEKFRKVIRINEGPRARRLIFSEPIEGARRPYGDNIRPQRESQLWVELDHEEPNPAACPKCGADPYQYLDDSVHFRNCEVQDGVLQVGEFDWSEGTNDRLECVNGHEYPVPEGLEISWI